MKFINATKESFSILSVRFRSSEIVRRCLDVIKLKMKNDAIRLFLSDLFYQTFTEDAFLKNSL